VYDIQRSEWLEPATKGGLLLLQSHLELERQRRLTALTYKFMTGLTIFLSGASVALWIVILALGK
jgi:hypothetical protein